MFEKIDNRAEEVRGKEVHVQYFRQTDEVASYKTWVWVQQGHLKKETERPSMAAQSQSLRTNAIKAKIDNSQMTLCRMCLQKKRE